MSNPLHATIGSVCDQSAEAGETVLILFDFRPDGRTYPVPLVFVIIGNDALDPQLVADALAALPATDVAAIRAAPSVGLDVSGVVLVGAWLIGFVAAMRRFVG